MSKHHKDHGRPGAITLLLIIALLISCNKSVEPEYRFSSLTDARKHAENGDPEAQFQLAMVYYRGEIVKPNDSIFQRWIHKAAASEHAYANYVLGLSLIAGERIPIDIAQGTTYLERATALGLPEAKSYLGAHYTQIYTSEMPINANRGKTLLMDCISQNQYPECYYHMGLLYETGREPEALASDNINYRRATKWYEQGAESLHLPSIEALAYVHKNRNNPKFSEKDAYFWAVVAQKSGSKNIFKLLAELEIKTNAGMRRGTRLQAEEWINERKSRQ